jgi:hypothetical protein
MSGPRSKCAAPTAQRKAEGLSHVAIAAELGRSPCAGMSKEKRLGLS